MSDEYIFKNQSDLSITLDTLKDISSGKEFKIKYIKPDETKGEFPGVILFEVTKVRKNFTDLGDVKSALNQNGYWIMWPWVLGADDRWAPGKAVKIYVWFEGQVRT